MLFLIFFKEKPETPPSKLALVFRQLSQSGIRDDIRTILRNKNLVFNIITFMMLWGTYITLGNCLSPLFGPQFTSAQISVIGMIFVLIGAVSCFLMGVFLDKTKNYIVAIRYVTISTFSLMAITPFVIPIGKMWITSIFAFCAGLFIVPVLPATYQYASTQSGKIPPMVVTGLMMSGG